MTAETAKCVSSDLCYCGTSAITPVWPFKFQWGSKKKQYRLVRQYEGLGTACGACAVVTEYPCTTAEVQHKIMQASSDSYFLSPT